jgi:hypothetical protein
LQKIRKTLKNGENDKKTNVKIIDNILLTISKNQFRNYKSRIFTNFSFNQIVLDEKTRKNKIQGLF